MTIISELIIVDADDPVEEQVSGGLHRAATVYVNDINSSRLVVPESSHGRIICITNVKD